MEWRVKFLDSREFYKSLFEYAPDSYYISDLEGTFIDSNKAAEKITGYHKNELVGKNFFQLNILPTSEIPKAQQPLEKKIVDVCTKLFQEKRFKFESSNKR